MTPLSYKRSPKESTGQSTTNSGWSRENCHAYQENHARPHSLPISLSQVSVSPYRPDEIISNDKVHRCYCEKNSTSTFPMPIEEDTRSFHSHSWRSRFEHGLEFLTQQGSGAVPRAPRKGSLIKEPRDSMPSTLDSEVFQYEFDITSSRQKQQDIQLPQPGNLETMSELDTQGSTELLAGNEYLLGQRNVLEDFSQVSHCLHEQSRYKLLQLPMLATVSTFMSRLPEPQTLATLGLEALRDVLIGCLPTSDIKIFAAIHVAYTCALCTTPQHLETIHEELFYNGMDWSQAVENNERFPLAAVIQQIWGPKPRHPRVEPQENDVISGVEETAELDKSNGLPFPSSWHCSAAYCTSPGVYAQDNKDILNSLQNSYMVRIFKQFLDSVEHATMSSSSQNLYRHSIESQSHTAALAKKGSLIREGITKPLKLRMITRQDSVLHNDDDMQALLPIVLDVEKLLDHGKLSSLRELELQLLHNARVKLRCLALYNAFLNDVSDLCDTASYSLDQSPLMRQRSYLRIIADTLIIPDPEYEPIELALETPQQRRANKKSPFRDTSGSSSTTNSRTSSGTSNFTILSAIATPSSIETVSDNSQGENVSKEIAWTKDAVKSTSPSILPKLGERRLKKVPYTTRPPSTYPSSSTSASSPVSCPYCNQLFNGNTRYAKQNLARHKKSGCKRPMFKPKKFGCLYEGCTKSFSRKDNLRKHQQGEGHNVNVINQVD